jgi:hypothetical protein
MGTTGPTGPAGYVDDRRLFYVEDNMTQTKITLQSVLVRLAALEDTNRNLVAQNAQLQAVLARLDQRCLGPARLDSPYPHAPLTKQQASAKMSTQAEPGFCDSNQGKAEDGQGAGDIFTAGAISGIAAGGLAFLVLILALVLLYKKGYICQRFRKLNEKHVKGLVEMEDKHDDAELPIQPM